MLSGGCGKAASGHITAKQYSVKSVAMPFEALDASGSKADTNPHTYRGDVDLVWVL